MSDTAETSPHEETFRKIAEECEKKFHKPKRVPEGVMKYKDKLGYCRFQKTAIHYELQHYASANMIGIEVHIEKESYDGKNDYEIKKEKVELLQKYLKYLADIKIFGKHIMYDPCWYDCGRIYLLCDYSMDKEKILCYINEFIYQTRERMNIIVPGWDEE
ncbi:MAG: hypothetical protein LBC64_11535 [Fibromonadaceae bacterium]|nr:hypothetical protein [Fibromonadaceae bacterium]